MSPQRDPFLNVHFVLLLLHRLFGCRSRGFGWSSYPSPFHQPSLVADICIRASKLEGYTTRAPNVLLPKATRVRCSYPSPISGPSTGGASDLYPMSLSLPILPTRVRVVTYTYAGEAVTEVGEPIRIRPKIWGVRGCYPTWRSRHNEGGGRESDGLAGMPGMVAGFHENEKHCCSRWTETNFRHYGTRSTSGAGRTMPRTRRTVLLGASVAGDTQWATMSVGSILRSSFPVTSLGATLVPSPGGERGRWLQRKHLP